MLFTAISSAALIVWDRELSGELSGALYPLNGLPT